MTLVSLGGTDAVDRAHATGIVFSGGTWLACEVRRNQLPCIGPTPNVKSPRSFRRSP